MNNIFKKEISPLLMRNAYPISLPHVSFNNNKLYFGAKEFQYSSIIHQDIDFFNLCDGNKTYKQILDFGFELPKLNIFKYLIWWDHPLQNNINKSKKSKNILVISPHPDDVEISMGGFLINNRNLISCSHLVCFNKVAYTNDKSAFSSFHDSTIIRNDESALASKMLDIENHYLDFIEFDIRNELNNKEEYKNQNNDKILKDTLKIKLYHYIKNLKPCDVFSPAAIGDHPDHRLIYDIVIEFFEDDFFPETTFHFYEDAPYCASYINVDNFLSRFENSYIGLSPWFEDISCVMKKKKILTDVFRSQFTISFINIFEDIARRNAAVFNRKQKNSAKTLGVERFWTLKTAAFI